MDELTQIHESLLEAREELKRLEHIIYVSLKYTRTVDVLVNALNRLVSTFDFIIEAFLEQAKEDGKIDKFPKSPALKAKKVEEIYSDDEEIKRHLVFYSFVRNVLKSPHGKRKEYRRHVTLIVKQDKCTTEIKIDHLTNCEKYIHNFFDYSWRKLIGVPKEDEDDF